MTIKGKQRNSSIPYFPIHNTHLDFWNSKRAKGNVSKKNLQPLYKLHPDPNLFEKSESYTWGNAVLPPIKS